MTDLRALLTRAGEALGNAEQFLDLYINDMSSKDDAKHTLLHVRALRAEITAAEAAPDNGWRDIASAPKDGTWIVLYFEDGRIRIASWFNHNDISHPHVWVNEYHEVIVRPWHEDEEPTHWRPLPPSPCKKA